MSFQNTTIQATMIGTGGMARHHLRQILTNFPNTSFPIVCEPSTEQFALSAEIFAAMNRPIPQNEPNLDRLLSQHAEQLDAAFIITPHKVHHEQAVACLEAGLDVLLEKPMVMTAAEATDLISVRDKTQRHLVVAFQGSLSPEVRTADKMLRSNMLGSIRTINGQVWQNWLNVNDESWRTDAAQSGGGFLFDTGAHMLNTVSDLAGEPFVEVAAWLDNRGRPVDINGVVIGRLQSGPMVTLNGCGEAFESCHSEVRIIGAKGMLRTGVWGRFLDVKYKGEDAWSAVPVPPSLGVWEQFLGVRSGQLVNPSPPEVGLRMAHLWDAIQASAEKGGQPVSISA